MSAADGTAATSGRQGWLKARDGDGATAADTDPDTGEEDEVLLERIGSAGSSHTGGLGTKGHLSISRSLTMDSFMQDIKASERYRRRRNAMHELDVAEIGETKRTTHDGTTSGAAGAVGGGGGGGAGAASSGSRRISSRALYPLADEEADAANTDAT